MGLLGFITRPIRRRIHGIQGEKKVHKKLNPMFFGKVEHEELKNVTLVDEYGNSHQIDFVEIRSNGVFCIEVKNFKGVVYGSENDENWTIMLGRKKYKQLNPLKQNKSHCYQISRLFNGKYQINSLIVLANNNAGNIKASNVVNLDDLRKYLALYKDGHTLRQKI